MNRNKRRAMMALDRRNRSLDIEARRIRAGLFEDHRPLTRRERRVVEGWQAPQRQWFHGGAPGLDVGEVLLPAAETGSDPRGMGSVDPERAGSVYITTYRWTAEFYASRIANGTIYVVQPEGHVTVDRFGLRNAAKRAGGIDQLSPDDIHDWCCSRARIVEVLGPVPASAREEMDAEINEIFGLAGAPDPS